MKLINENQSNMSAVPEEQRERINKILDFWYDGVTKNGAVEENQIHKWCGHRGYGIDVDALDEMLKNEFQQDLENYVNGEYDSWNNDHEGVLAAIILTDQFTRNIYRHEAKAYASDHMALKLALNIVDRRCRLSEYKFWERTFILMPLIHAEHSVYTTKKAYSEIIALNSEMEDTGIEGLNCKMEDFRMHLVVIEKFGRYPHRNAVLGRESTAEEVEFLKTAETWGQGVCNKK